MPLIRILRCFISERWSHSLKAWTFSDRAADNVTEDVTGEIPFLSRWFCKKCGEPVVALTKRSLKINISFFPVLLIQHLRMIATFSSAWSAVFEWVVISSFSAASKNCVALVTVAVSNSLRILFYCSSQ